MATPSEAGAYTIIDLEHLGRPESVAACVIATSEGPLVVDPGPAVTLPKLREGLTARGFDPAALAGLLLTHIHLDHAGAAGTLAREQPSLQVYVHEAGAPHLIDPTKLLDSARRLYGSRMDELWGEVAPVPAAQVRSLAGKELLRFGERSIAVAYTPGHAWHHVSYFDRETSVAFVGDTAGIYGPRLPVVLPVTPPPDFDLERWLGSIAEILGWRPAQIVLTHFGPAGNPEAHFAELREGLLAWAGYARDSLQHPGSDAERLALFLARLRSWMAGRAPAELAERFLEGAGPEACWQGLARYWRKRG